MSRSQMPNLPILKKSMNPVKLEIRRIKMNHKVNIIAVISITFSILANAHQHSASCSHDHESDHEHKHSASCSHDHENNHEHKYNKEEEKCEGSHRVHQHNKILSVSKAIQQVMGLKTVHAEKRRIVSTLSFAGRYELIPDARKVVSSPIAGRLTLLVKTLDNVRKGDPLFTVTSPELVARSREIALLEKRLKVYREIKTPNAALENELALKRAERKAMLAGADEHDGVVTVCAATDGMVESLIAQDGSWLETGASAIQIVRTQHLRFKALVTASDAINLKNGMSAKVGADLGKIRIGIGDDSGLVPVYVLFDKDVNVLAGVRSRAECVTDEIEAEHIAVPSSCIVSIGLQPTVFVRDMHNHEQFIAIPVTPVSSGAGWTAVEGLPNHHCEVVNDGAYELKLALPASGESKPAGHFHADGTFHEGEH